MVIIPEFDPKDRTNILFWHLNMHQIEMIKNHLKQTKNYLVSKKHVHFARLRRCRSPTIRSLGIACADCLHTAK